MGVFPQENIEMAVGVEHKKLVKSGFYLVEIFIGIDLAVAGKAFVQLSGEKNEPGIGGRWVIGVMPQPVNRNQRTMIDPFADVPEKTDRYRPKFIPDPFFGFVA